MCNVYMSVYIYIYITIVSSYYHLDCSLPSVDLTYALYHPVFEYVCKFNTIQYFLM